MSTELSRKLLLSRKGTGEDNQSAGLLVDSVDDA